MQPLPETLLNWLDESAELGVYAVSGGTFVYANRAFRALIGQDEHRLAEFSDRLRHLPEQNAPSGDNVSAGAKPPLRLPAQPLRVQTCDGVRQRFLAQEWLMQTNENPLIVGCVKPLNGSTDSNRSLLRVALYDALTDLPNRSLLEDRLFQVIARVRRSGRLAALLYLDLDGFKPVNDKYGHQAGDLVLQTVGGRLLASVRETDTVARLGGDEFAIVLEDPEHLSQVELVAKKIIAHVGEPIALPDGASVCVTCSIGISLCPTNGINLRALMNAADQAMYASKSLGSGQFSVSAEIPTIGSRNWMDEHEAELIGVPEIDRQHDELIAIANRLHHAIENAESQEIQSALLDELISFTQFHFAAEEVLMDRYHDPNSAAHKRQHTQLVEQVQFFRHALSQSDSQMILSALRPWLIRHIKTYDRALGVFLQAQGVH